MRTRAFVVMPLAVTLVLSACAAQSTNDVVRLLPPLRDNVSAMVENRLLALDYRVINREQRLQGFTQTAIKREVDADFTAHEEELLVSVTDVRAAIGSPQAGQLRGHNIRVRIRSRTIAPDGTVTELDPSAQALADVEALLASLGAN